MILNDRAIIRTEGSAQTGTVLCMFGHQKSDVVTSDGAAASFPVQTATILVALPMLDADTGVPLGIDPDDAHAFVWRGRLWGITQGPTIRRQHGVDHHAAWTLQKGVKL